MTAMPKVDVQSKEYQAALPNWALVDALMGGTDAMRQARTTYLPQEEKESVDAYNLRLAQSFLFPGYKRAIETYVGKPLEKQITVDEKADARLKDWLQNVDLTGRTIDSFARDVFRSALNKGITYILVDYPTVTDAASKTQAQEQELGVRPYAVHIRADQIFAWKSEVRNGAQVLTQVRIAEIAEEPDPANPEFGIVEVNKIRVLEPGRVRVYRQSPSKEWSLEKDVSTTYTDAIPLVVIYTNRLGFMCARPALIDLAHINVTHWQSTSDQRNILHVARVPFLHIATADADNVHKLTIGASRAITTAPNETVKWVEHQGTAIAAGHDDIEQLQNDMASYGMELFQKPSGTVTATQRVLDQATTDTVLSVMARALKDGLEEMCRIMLKWIGQEVDTTGILDVQTDFRVVGDASELTVLWNMRMNGDISQEQFWAEMKRRGILSEGFDPEKERALLEAEVPPEVDLTDPTGDPNQDPQDKKQVA